MALGSPQWMYKSGEAYQIDQSLKFNDDDSAYLSKTFASAGNRRTWTWSAWIKRSNSSATHMLFFTAVAGDLTEDDHFGIRLDSGASSNIVLTWGDGNTAITNAIFRDPSAWMHIVVAIDTTQGTDTNRVKVYVNGTQQTFSSTDLPSQNFEYGINKAHEHNLGSRVIYGSSANYYDGYMAEVNFVDGQALTPSDFGETGTYGEWKPIEYEGTYGTNGFYLPFKQDYTVEGFSTVTYKGTGVNPTYIGGTGYRPDLTWIKPRSTADNHVLYDSVRGYDNQLKVNATDAEDTNGRVASANDGFTLKTTDGNQNSASHTYVAWNWDMGANTPTGFGCVTYKGNGGTQDISGFGFRPDVTWIKARHTTYDHYFEDRIRGAGKVLYWNKTVAEETLSGNGIKSFNPDGFRTGTESGHNENNGTYVSYGWDMGGTSVTNTTGSINSTVMANPTYGQSLISFDGNSTNGATVGHGLSSAPEVVLVMNRERAHNPTMWHTSIPNTHYLHLDGTAASAQNTAYWNSTSPTSSVFSLGTSNDINANGENLMALCFHSVSGYSKFGSYTGNGNLSGPSVTLGFRPAWVMIKKTSGASDWLIFDSTRNPLNEVRTFIEANTTDADDTEQTTNYELGIDFDNNGFQIKARGGGMNGNGATYVYLAFAGGMDSISTYNTTGSIDSRVKANPTYGQSIVKYTGNTASSATVGHGLNSAPEFMIVRTTAANAWAVYHASIGNTHLLEINTNAGKADNNEFWNDTSPTNSVFTIGSHNEVNHTQDYMAYCFHSVTGYSKFGSYTGNGSATGTVVTTGFAPAFVVIKRSDASANWYMYDNTREPEAEKGKALYPNLSNAESGDYERLKFTSTGFQLTHTDTDLNGSGGTYIYMAFADKREYAYWLDQSGNNNDWTSNNLTESDISVDSPTNNFCTWNPLQAGDAGSMIGTLSQGNLKHYLSGSGQALTMGTIAPTTGKWYCEFTMGDPSGAGSDRSAVGIGDIYDVDVQGSGNADKTVMVSTSTANRVWLTDNVESDGNFSARSTGDIIQFAWDIDAQKVWVGINNTWYNSSGSSISSSDVPAGNNPTVTDTGFTALSPLNRWSAGSSITQTHFLNCGQDSSFSGNKTAQGNQDSNEIGDFYYTPPTGFLALCTKNLPDVDVKPQEHFNTVTYTGNNATSLAITGVGFQPDFLWLKRRDSGASHYLVDAVRGRAAGLLTNSDIVEYTTSDTTRDLRSFDSDGFTVGQDYYFSVNTSSATYVAWNWKANGSGGTSHTQGTITSTVSVNTDAKFSIGTYTGNGTNPATIGHGLGVVPDIIIVKKRDTSNDNWTVYHTGMHSSEPEDYFMKMNETAAASDNHTTWNDTAPTATLFTTQNDSRNNASGAKYLFYAWKSVEGYSKFGSYTGNGNADGTFVYTGFRPAFVIIKPYTDTGEWPMYDNKRNPTNVTNKVVRANANNAESTESGNAEIDMVSNGFKPRGVSGWQNTNGRGYIYMAFAETPFKYSNAR